MSRPYQAPLQMMRSALMQAAEISGARAIAGYDATLSALAEPVLESAARFAGDVLSPLNSIGDRAACSLGPRGVVTAPGFVDAYRRFREDGWVSAVAPAEHGGQALPALIGTAISEMWGGANLAFAMCPELAAGSLEMLRVHGSKALIDQYAGGIASGEWTASMCLTEPEAGSDLSLLRVRAEPDGDAWRLYGRKIFISWGEHDLSENIVHFVLARTPNAPPGLKGISLFLVPKRIPAPSGLIANDIQAVSLEHKMGIRASPTCAMALGERAGALGWLVGRVNEGLACMFTIMNPMRLGVGAHSTGLAERALQLARAHAEARIQGHGPDGNPRAIIEHADVRRMLLTMKALIHAGRCLAYTCAATLDVARHGPDSAAREQAQRRADLLTPLVKGWCSDIAVEVASLGVQVHGGSGYVDDAEISQVYRDARIGPIFEGTNYIQAQDLLARKVIRDQGAALASLLADVTTAAKSLPPEPHRLGSLRTQLIEAGARLSASAGELAQRAAGEPDLIGATAYHFLHALGLLAGGWQWAVSVSKVGDPAATSGRAVLDTAVFYAAHILPRIHWHEAAICAGAKPVTEALIDGI